jgi:hypothetical protein
VRCPREQSKLRLHRSTWAVPEPQCDDLTTNRQGPKESPLNKNMTREALTLSDVTISTATYDTFTQLLMPPCACCIWLYTPPPLSASSNVAMHFQQMCVLQIEQWMWLHPPFFWMSALHFGQLRTPFSALQRANSAVCGRRLSLCSAQERPSWCSTWQCAHTRSRQDGQRRTVPILAGRYTTGQSGVGQ